MHIPGSGVSRGLGGSRRVKGIGPGIDVKGSSQGQSVRPAVKGAVSKVKCCIDSHIVGKVKDSARAVKGDIVKGFAVGLNVFRAGSRAKSHGGGAADEIIVIFPAPA